MQASTRMMEFPWLPWVTRGFIRSAGVVMLTDVQHSQPLYPQALSVLRIKESEAMKLSKNLEKTYKNFWS